MKPVLEKLQSGLLIVKLKEEDRQELTEYLEKYGSVDAWGELLEWYVCNGWKIPSADEFALCSNPYLLTDNFELRDNGKADYGVIYFYAAHESKCPVAELLEFGAVVLSATED